MIFEHTARALGRALLERATDNCRFRSFAILTETLSPSARTDKRPSRLNEFLENCRNNARAEEELAVAGRWTILLCNDSRST